MAKAIGVGYTGKSQYGGNYDIVGGQIQTPTSNNSGASSNGGSSSLSNSLTNLAQSAFNSMTTQDTPYASYARDLFDYSSKNSAFNAEQAEEARAWSHKENQLAMAHSAEEAEKNRKWQEQLSNTAHQREVKDLVAAGLNPVLSVNGGASTPTGSAGSGYSGGASSASADSSASSVAGLFSSILNNAAQLYMQDNQLRFNYAQLAQSKELQELGFAVSKYMSDNSLRGQQISSAAQLNSASIMSAAQKYSSDNTYKGLVYSTDANNQAKKDTSLVGTVNDLFSSSMQSLPDYGPITNAGNLVGYAIDSVYRKLLDKFKKGK